MRCTSVLLLLFSGLASAQTDVRTVLEQLAASCRRLYLAGYAVDIERKLDQHQRFTEQAGPRAGDNDNTAHMFLAHAGKSGRYDRNQGGLWFELLTDGTTEWAWRRDLKLCTEKPAQPWPERLGPGEGVPHEEWRYLTKYLAAPGMAGATRLVNEDVPPDSVCTGPSVIVSIDLGSESEGLRERVQGTEELRILTKSHLPCRAVSKRVYRVHGRATTMLDITETITWRFRDVTGDMFEPPPASVKRVKKFPRPSGPAW